MENAPFVKTKILIIDDQRDVHTTYEAVLKSSLPECELISAFSGPEGIAKTISEAPDTILLDLRMPGMDGFEVCGELKSMDETKHIPVIMITALHKDTKSKLKGLDCGADAFLTKPIDYAEMIAQVKVALRMKKNEDALRDERDRLEDIVKVRTKELIRVNRVLATRSECNRSVVKAEDEPDLLNQACRIVVETGGYRLAWVGYAENDLEKSIRPVARYGYDSGYVDSARLTWADNEKGRGPGGTAIRTGNPFVVRHIMADDAFAPWRSEAVKRGYASGAALPLCLDNRCIGSLNVYAVEADAFDEKELNMLTGLAEDLACGIETMRMRKRQRESEERRRISNHLLEILNASNDELDAIREIIDSLKQFTGFDAVGIRLKNGDDYPYFETRGFPEQFVKAENYLCARNQAGKIITDANGAPVLECMCGNILQRRTDPSLPFFTKHGGFWTNSTSRLLASTSEKERQARTRNRCNGEGYESVALIPIRHENETIGLIQLNDYKPNRLSIELVEFIEGIGMSIGIALARKQAMEALRQSEEKYRILVDSTDDFIYSLDLEGRHTAVNKSVVMALGLKEKEVIGKNHTELGFPDDIVLEWRALHQRVFDTKRIVRVETTTKMPDGADHDYEVVLMPIFNEKGDVDGIRGISRDITERKKIQADAMRIANLASLGELAAGVAHEINNPITGIISIAEILKKTIEKHGEDPEVPDMIIKEGERIAGIVGNLLSFARRKGDEFSPVNINTVLDNALALLQKQMSKTGIRVNIRMPDDLPMILGTAGEIQQVFINLLSNAAYSLNKKYPADHENKILEITGERLQRNNSEIVRITFHDRGVGVEKSIQNKLCNPFFTTKPQNEGAGLGLSISHGIIEKHHGTISFESEEKEYMKIVVDFPAMKEQKNLSC